MYSIVHVILTVSVVVINLANLYLNTINSGCGHALDLLLEAINKGK